MGRRQFQSGNSATKRVAARLGGALDKRLFAYAAAASAAGVSLLALAQPAEGKIVYTKANHEIAPNKILNLDLNHDGITDFSFSNHSTEGSSYRHVELKIAPQGRNGVLDHAAVLDSGVQIGPKGRFQTSTQRMLQFSISCSRTTQGGASCRTQVLGGWKNITNGYLGLKFYVKGKAHYGWARLNVTVTDYGPYGLLTGYAYETIANKPIVTGKTKGANAGVPANPSENDPEPATLGALARGAAGLGSWRRLNASGK